MHVGGNTTAVSCGDYGDFFPMVGAMSVIGEALKAVRFPSF